MPWPLAVQLPATDVGFAVSNVRWPEMDDLSNVHPSDRDNSEDDGPGGPANAKVRVLQEGQGKVLHGTVVFDRQMVELKFPKSWIGISRNVLLAVLSGELALEIDNGVLPIERNVFFRPLQRKLEVDYTGRTSETSSKEASASASGGTGKGGRSADVTANSRATKADASEHTYSISDEVVTIRAAGKDSAPVLIFAPGRDPIHGRLTYLQGGVSERIGPLSVDDESRLRVYYKIRVLPEDIVQIKRGKDFEEHLKRSKRALIALRLNRKCAYKEGAYLVFAHGVASHE